MPQPPKRRDLWRLPTMALWAAFFAAGLVPELAFAFLRQVGGVVSQNAFVNSPFAVTLLLSGFIGVFTFSRCRAAGVGEAEALGKAVQVAVIGLAGFFGYPRGSGAEKEISLVGLLSMIPAIPHGMRWAVILACSLKLAAWWYLVTLLLRYYLFGNVNTFATMVSLFPSSHREDPRDRSQPTRVEPGNASEHARKDTDNNP